MITDNLFLIVAFTVLTVLLGATSSVLLVPAWRSQLVEQGSARMSSADSQYFKSFILSLSEIWKRVLFLIPGLFVGLICLSMITITNFSLSWVLINVVKALAIIVPLLIAVAYLTLLERKVMASMQRRKGPNVVGLYGLLQPLADGLKLFLKETIIPASAHKGIFILSPILTFFLAVMGWAVIPFGEGMVYADINVGILYMFAVGGLGVYGVICSGWSSNTKYSFIGALRSAAQMISYELGMGFILLLIFLMVGSLNLTDIVLAQQKVWFFIPLFPAAMIWLVCILAETNRAPFDLPEAEAELVAGYFTEYSAMGFALFFLGEYANMIFMSGLCAILFLGGWYPPFNITFLYWIPGSFWLGLKVIFFLFLFIWVRAAFPRYRYDQLMRLGWKVFLPLSLGWVIFVAGVLISFNWLPA